MKNESYEEYVEKFKPKKTTDDCYTPPEVYEVIKDWVCRRYGTDPEKIIRPFWPGADYQSMEYPEGCVVVDNPPFSILSKICEYYLERGIPFFLFAPSLTCLNGKKDRAADEPYYLRLQYRIRKWGGCKDVFCDELRAGDYSTDVTGTDKAGE